MKSLIVLVVGLLSVGCLTPEQKQKRLRDSVVGEYEYKPEFGTTHKQVFLENGVYESYIKGKRHAAQRKWSIVDGEIHVKYDSGEIVVRRINPDKSITSIATIRDGKRTDNPSNNPYTSKKIK